jgi:ABC-type antimicrobial peptide transport system permease subunit
MKMSSIDREEEIKRSLKEDIYTHLNRLENLEDDTFASTKRLANILEGYVTKVDDLSIEEENKVLEILEELEVNIEASDERLLTEYNAKFHEMGLDTLSQILEVPQMYEESEQNIELETENTITIMKIEHEEIVDPSDHNFDTSIEEIVIDDIDITKDEINDVIIGNDDVTLENLEIEHQLVENTDETEEKKHRSSRLTFVDYFLFLIVIILAIIIVFIFLGGL